MTRARKHVAMQLSPCHRLTCAKGAPQVIGRCLTTLFAPTAFGDIKGEIGATLLVLSRLKHMKCPQTYTSFPGTGETVTVENRDVFVEATWTYSQQHPWFNGQLVIHDSRSKACCCATLAVSQGRLCERRTAGDWRLLSQKLRPSLLVSFGLKP